MITITEVTGNENISLARLTYNNNFLLVENEINELEDVFNINLNTGSLDCSSAVGGVIKAKTLAGNTLLLPASGSPTVSISGASGSIAVSGTGSFANISVSGTGAINNISATGATFSALGSVYFGGTASFGGPIVYGTGARKIIKNVTVDAGVTGGTDLLTYTGTSGGGATGTYTNPYLINGTENVIYVDASIVSSGTTGFFMAVSPTGASGATASALPAGFTVTLVSSNATGFIPAGVTGNIPGTNHFYTGLNSTLYSGITFAGTQKFKASVTLMWEPKINQSGTYEHGSWIVINASNNVTY